VPILETIEPGLGGAVQLRAIVRGGGMLMAGMDGLCRGIDAVLIYELTGDLVGDIVLQVSFRSSIALSDGAVEIRSSDLSDSPARATMISASDTPRP
jgi:hypothetical protein